MSESSSEKKLRGNPAARSFVRLLDSPTARLAHFFMFDFTSIEWRATRYEGIFLHALRRDVQTGDSTVLIRMRPGCGYPAHQHNGVEEVLILQGGYRDQWGEHRAGDYVLNEAGSSHHPVALDGSEDCIMVAVAHAGIRLLNRD